MKNVLDLLEEKNHTLLKFIKLNDEQTVYLLANEYGKIEEFYENREALLDVIEYLDKSLEKSSSHVDYEMINQIENLLNTKDILVKKILAQDLEIMAVVESVKSGIIFELSQLSKTKKTINGYKSPDFKRKLDKNT